MLNSKKLKNYRYHCIDNSILQKLFLSKLLNFSFKFVPNNIAPNLITLTGFLSCIVSFIFLNFINNLFPKYINYGFLLCSFSIFFYWICDGVDGKQARKTNSSSVLGQCFDHTVDSLVMPIILLILLKALEIKDKKIIFIIILFSSYNFICYSLIEKYTGIFELDYINPSNEGTMFCCLFFFLKGIKLNLVDIFIKKINKLLFKINIGGYSIFNIGLVFIILENLFNLFNLILITKGTFSLIYESMIFLYTILFCINMPNTYSFWNIISISFLFSIINLEIIISNLNKNEIIIPFINELQYLFYQKESKYINIFVFFLIFIRYSFHIILRIKEFESCLNIKWYSIKKNIN